MLGICAEKYNRSTRKKCVCPYCSFAACRKCIKTYLLGSFQDPHCMVPDCKKCWSREILVNLLPKTWFNGELKRHREDVLYNREQALLPSTQLMVAELRDIDKTIKNSEQDIKELLGKIAEINKSIGKFKDRRYKVRNGKEKLDTKRQFIRACPVENCRGFLSTAWKCGLCEIWVCPACHGIKKEKNDGDHKCNEDEIKTAQLLKKETKACPKCGISIFKIVGGCDQIKIQV